MRTVLNCLKDFARDKRGNFATMFVVMGTTLLMGSALAIDVARMFQVHNKLVFAVDAAVLATTQGLTLGDIELKDAETAVRKYIDANLDERNITVKTVDIDSIKVDKVNRSLEVKAHTLMPMTFTGIVGYDNHRIDATSKAQFSNTEVEVVMALDVTGSMDSKIGGRYSPTKLSALKDAAKLGVKTLFEDMDSGDRIRVGLVPYSEAVNAEPVIDKISTTGVTKTYCSGWWWNKNCWTETTYPDCVRERTGPQRFTDAFASPSAKIGSSEYSCPNAKILPLTASQSTLNNRIDSFRADGCTAGHIAIAWAYYMMSSKWNSAWPTDSKAADFDEPGTSKYAIIMTDGEFNTFESNGHSCSSYGTNLSEDYALGLCSAMKNSGIKVYSIAFAAGSSAESLMKNCASSSNGSKNYYNATNEDSLEAAFLEIARDIKGLRLVN